MTEFELEDEVVQILIHSEFAESKKPLNEKASQIFHGTEGVVLKGKDGAILQAKGEPFISGDVFKCGTRTEIRNEDIVVEILSIDSEQFQTAVVSVRAYVDDLNIGSPIPVPNITRLTEITRKFESVFKTRNSAYALTTPKYRMKLESIKRERKVELHQHCVNCMFNFLICNF